MKKEQLSLLAEIAEMEFIEDINAYELNMNAAGTAYHLWIGDWVSQAGLRPILQEELIGDDQVVFDVVEMNELLTEVQASAKIENFGRFVDSLEKSIQAISVSDVESMR